jgi:transmembrane sensor
VDTRATKTIKPEIITEASAWFVEFRASDVTGSGRARFDEWLRQSPEHIQAYLEIAAAWAELPTSDPDRRLDIATVVQRAQDSTDENVVTLPPRRVSPQRQHRTFRTWAACLGGVSFAVVLSLIFYILQADTYRTGVGVQRTVELADGSSIELNVRSQIRVRLSRKVREVDLIEGQALFHVAKDPARPFVVRSGPTNVRAVGTQFDVYRKDTGTTVTVVEGRVAVAPAGQSQEDAVPAASSSFLAAGDQITVPTESSPSKVTPPRPVRADVAAATAWVQKRLIFEETPLAKVAEEFNRYSTRRLVILDPQLRSVEISGVYSASDPDSLLGFLRAQPNIQLRETEQEIQITVRTGK